MTMAQEDAPVTAPEKEAHPGAWAKVPAWVLGLGLSSLELRVLIALLAFADPRRPSKPVWPGGRTIARTIGLADNLDSARCVYRALRRLEARGLLENQTVRGCGLTVSLRPVLDPQGDVYASYTGDVYGSCTPMCTVRAHPQNRPRTNHAKTDQTPSASSAPSARSRKKQHLNGPNGHGLNLRERGLRHRDADREVMLYAWRNARAGGVSWEGFRLAVESRPDLSAVDVNSAACGWAERCSGAKNPDASFLAWLKRERGFGRTWGGEDADDVE